MKISIFYFSATGNSLYTALEIAKALGDTEVVSMAKAGMNYICDSEVIGFVFPTYSWGLPNIVSDFLKSGSFNKSAYFFSVVTCGGAIGSSLADVNDILKKKEAHLHYGSKLAFLSNYILMVDIKTDKVAGRLQKTDKNLSVIIQDIKNRKENRIKGGPALLKRMHEKSAANRQLVDKDYSVSSSCAGCGICASVCPVKNIELINGKVTFKHNCEQCLACVHWCPQKAISYKDVTQQTALSSSENKIVSIAIISFPFD